LRVQWFKGRIQTEIETEKRMGAVSVPVSIIIL